MKNNLIAFSTLLVTLASCANSSSEKATTEQSVDTAKTNIKSVIKEDQLAMKKDPVCGMVVYNYLEDTTLYKGKIYGFCGKGCKDEFLNNPDSIINVANSKTPANQ